MEVEAGRGYHGNAMYRDIIWGSLMVDIDYYIIAIPISYKYNRGISKDYNHLKKLADTIYSQRRFELPYRLIIIGY